MSQRYHKDLKKTVHRFKFFAGKRKNAQFLLEFWQGHFGEKTKKKGWRFYEKSSM